MINTERAGQLASTLAADGATVQACADCLVPEDLMRSILGQALGVSPDAIDLTYPHVSDDTASEKET